MAGKCQARPKGQSHNWEHDYYPAPDEEGENEDGDEDFYDTLKSKRVRQKKANAESARRMAEVEYLKNPVERLKRFKSSKDGIFAKLKEIDSVCGSESFALVISVDKDFAFYQGSDQLVAQFFTVGLARASFVQRLNVRRFEENEIDYKVCAVSHCVVSRYRYCMLCGGNLSVYVLKWIFVPYQLIKTSILFILNKMRLKI